MKKLICKRCQHSWYPRSGNIPKICPKCKSPYWNTEKRPTYKYLSWADRQSLQKAIDHVMMKIHREEENDPVACGNIRLYDEYALIPDDAIRDALKLSMLRKGALWDKFKQDEALEYLRSC